MGASMDSIESDEASMPWPLEPADMSKTSSRDRRGRLAWQVPLAAAAITFVLATGLSLSNQDIRPAVQTIGLVLMALWCGRSSVSHSP